MRIARITLLVVTGAAAATLVAQNTEVVDFHLLFWTLSMSRIVLLLLAMMLGFVGGFIVADFRRRSARAL